MNGRKAGNAPTISPVSKETLQMDSHSKTASAPRRLWGLGALVAAALLVGAFSAAPAGAADCDVEPFQCFDFESTAASLSSVEAGDHADFITDFELNGDPNHVIGGIKQPWGALRDVSVELPAGLLGNPAAFPTCKTSDLIAFSETNLSPCPFDAQIGIAAPGLFNFGPAGLFKEPLYNLPSPGGDVVARLGFIAVLYPVLLDVRVDPQRDYALTVTVVNTPANAGVAGTITTAWGVPTDSSHDPERGSPGDVLFCLQACVPAASTLPPTPFMSNPTSCGPAAVGFEAHNYADVAATPSTAPLLDITRCDTVPFDPTLSLQPTTRSAAAASGVDFSLVVPQDGLLNPAGRASAHLKKAVITMPEGVSLNASAADGLGSCSQAEIGVSSVSPLRFNDQDPTCPDASKVGFGEIVTPVLDDPLRAELFLADQNDNPFDSLLAGYMVAKGRGIRIKVAGKFDIDPQTGRLTATFDNNPQQPFSSLELHFKGGNRGVITTPSECGTYDVDYELTPWSGNAPDVGTTQFTIDENCDVGGFNPGFRAGSANTLAGAFTTFALRVTRNAGTPQLTGVSVDPPLGLTGSLAGIPYCPDSALNAVSGALGTGNAEIASPSCPAASQVGTVVAGAGSGDPFYVDTGRVYLAGPYRGAPFSFGIITPAVAGPFDLGNVMVRTAVNVDPRTAQIHAVSDPLPTILQGIPLDLRDVRVLLDRQGFAINPTSCLEKSSSGKIDGTNGASANVTDRFQVGECASLGFKPRMTLRLRGGTKRGKHPQLTAILRPRPGDANISNISVAFPRSEFLENAHIRTVCTRPDFAADNCPRGAIYGEATVFTPLLDEPLTGPVYLRSSDNLLPDLVPDLRGTDRLPIRIESAGRTDSIRGGIRNTFDFVPDAPFTKFVLRMQGGKKGLLVNSRDICARAYRATVEFGAHNGRTHTATPKLQTRCGSKAKRGRLARASAVR